MGAGVEFLVIGAQQAGTSALRRWLRDHPQVWLPEGEDWPFFSDSREHAQGLEAGLRRVGAPPDLDRVRGIVAPRCMHGWHDATTATIAGRVARALPEVKLVALLRDPVERARSQHATALASGRETRGFDRAARELLRPEALQAARFLPDDTNSYLAQGEYGRILGEYLRFFPRRALHVVLAPQLDDDPLSVLRGVARFLGVDPDHGPADQELRSSTEGSPVPSPEPGPIADDVREELDLHFAADAEVLREALGIDAPWRAAAPERRRRQVVYTAIAGGKDELVEPDIVSPGWDYVCFTDDPHLRSATWQIRPLELVEADPARRARRPKVLAHRYLPEYSTSLWIDGNMKLRERPDRFARRYLGAEPLVLFRHPDGERGAYEEGDVCVERGKDDPDVIRAQLERYRVEGIPAAHPVSPTGAMLRRHLEDSVAALSEAWWNEIRSGSNRDQLALAAVMWRRRPQFTQVDADLRDNSLVIWHPHVTIDRTRAIRGRIERAETVVVGAPGAGLSRVRHFLAAYAGGRSGEDGSLDLLETDRLPPVELGRDHVDVFGDAPAPARLLNEDLLLSRRLVVLVRDPRDSLVSSWRRGRLRQEGAIDEPLELFADCPAHGIERISASTALLLDLHGRARPGDRLLVRHEDLVDRPGTELPRVLRFALNGRDLDEGALASALDAGSPESLSADEAADDYETRMSEKLQRHVEGLPCTAALLHRLTRPRGAKGAVE